VAVIAHQVFTAAAMVVVVEDAFFGRSGVCGSFFNPSKGLHHELVAKNLLKSVIRYRVLGFVLGEMIRKEDGNHIGRERLLAIVSKPSRMKYMLVFSSPPLNKFNLAPVAPI
jgi:hypothetical protein